jgi:spermidine/putrescine transport system permease protein
LKNIRFPLILFPGVTYIFIFLFIPLLILLVYALSPTEGMNLDLSYLTLRNIIRIFTSPIYRIVILNSFTIALQSTAIALLLGFFPAYYLARTKSKYKMLLLVLFLLPFWTPYIVRVFSWLILLYRTGPLNQLLLFTGIISEPKTFLFSRGALLTVLVYSNLPFMIFPIFTSILGIKNSYLEAAKNLGATEFQAFTQVVLPLSLPGIWAGCILTFMLGLSSYAAPAIVGGPKDQMISQVIVDRFLFLAHWSSGGALAIVFITITLVLMYFANKLVPLTRIFKI